MLLTDYHTNSLYVCKCHEAAVDCRQWARGEELDEEGNPVYDMHFFCRIAGGAVELPDDQVTELNDI